MEPKILYYREGIFKYNPEVLTLDKEEEIDINVASIVRLQRDSDNFGFQFTFTYKVEEKILMEYGFIVMMTVAGWIPVTSSDSIDTTSPETEDKSVSDILFSRAPGQVNSACRAIMDFARGAMSAKLVDTTKSNVEFPDIDMEEFAKTINFRVIG